MLTPENTTPSNGAWNATLLGQYWQNQGTIFEPDREEYVPRDAPTPTTGLEAIIDAA